MRRLPAAILLFLVAACSGGASRNGGPDTSSTTTPALPTEAEDVPSGRSGGTADASSGGSDVCSEYIACIAKKAPEMLDPVTAAYGKSGSCWDEMSVASCEDACAAGKTKTGCGVCNPSSGNCLGEACTADKRCAKGEECARGKCIEQVAKTCDTDADCPDTHGCFGAGCGYACLLRCATDADCPANRECISVGNGESACNYF
jgi:hypothetical protein